MKILTKGMDCLKNSKGLSLIEALGGLAILSIVIFGTVGSANYLNNLKYAVDIKVIDQHFNFIHRLLAYGNCDSFIGDELNPDYVNTDDSGKGLTNRKDNTVPEIKLLQPVEDSAGNPMLTASGDPIYKYEVLYAVKDAVLQNSKPVSTALKDTNSDTDSHISIKSMSLEKESSSDYAILKVIFHSDKAKKASPKSTRLDPNDKELDKGEVERSLRIYMELDGSGIIQSCGLTPTSCPKEDRTVEAEAVTYTSSGLVIKDCLTGKPRDPTNPPKVSEPAKLKKTPSGEFKNFEYFTDYCVCHFQFYCQDGYWNDNHTCMEKPP